MGCINKSYMTTIRANKLNKEKRKFSEVTSIQIYSKKLYKDNFPQKNSSQNIDCLIENNPLPFVKIKRKKNL